MNYENIQPATEEVAAEQVEETKPEQPVRTQAEIKQRLLSIQGLEDYFCTQRISLLGFLEYDDAKEVTGGKISGEEFAEIKLELSKESIKQHLFNFMSVAFASINNKHAFASHRNLEQLWMLLWVYGDDELFAEIEKLPLFDNGRNIFTKVAMHFGWNASAWD